MRMLSFTAWHCLSILRRNKSFTFQNFHTEVRSMELENAKKVAAYAAVNEQIQSGYAVGIGSGSTVVFAVQRLAERIKNKELDNIRCVPSSFQALQLIRSNGLQLTDLEQCPELDVAIDGADEIDSNHNCIKGGGGCLTQEKIVAVSAKKFVLIADYTKQAKQFGDSWKNGIPVEVIPMAYAPVMKKIENILKAKPVLRLARAKAGPVITDNGNFILDCPFELEKSNQQWQQTNVNIKMIPGVVETGLFIGMVNKIYIGRADGTVHETVC